MMLVMRVLVLLVLCAGVAAAQPVDPAAKARADAAYAEGSQAYTAGDYVTAARKFEDAYAAVPDPAYLFNIGQAYRQSKDCVKSAASFRELIKLVPTASNIDQAKDLLREQEVCAIFVEGRRLMGAGRPAEACEKFAIAFDRDPEAVGTLLNLGLCSEQIGKLATAADWFRKAAKKAKQIKVEEAVKEAKQRLDAIESKIPKVDITITGAANASVKLDGKELALTTNVEVDPGRHTVEAQAPERAKTETFEIAIGGRTNLEIALEGTSSRGSRSNRVAYILGGVGLTLWVGTAVLGVVGKSKYDEAADFDEQDKWKSIVRYGGTSMFVLGTAAITTSVILYVRNRGRRSDTTVLAPAVSNGQLGIVLGGSF